MEKKVEVHSMITVTRDFELMMVCALRYSIGRESYMPSIAIDYIRYLIPMLSVNTLFILQRDITEEVERYNRSGWDIFMKDEWLKLADDIRNEHTRRKAEEA